MGTGHYSDSPYSDNRSSNKMLLKKAQLNETVRGSLNLALRLCLDCCFCQDFRFQHRSIVIWAAQDLGRVTVTGGYFFRQQGKECD